MHRDEVLEALRGLKPILQERWGVESLALFGSTARGDNQPGSDIDLLISFNHTTFDIYCAVLEELEKRFPMKVDLVTEKGVKPAVRPYIQRDAIYV